MTVTWISLAGFRNLGIQTVEFGPKINVVVGQNGQGKTNLVESVQVLRTAKSFRVSELKHLREKSHDLSTTAADLHGGEDEKLCRLRGEIYRGSLRDLVQMDLRAGRSTATVNGKKASSEDLNARYPTVLFSPESLAAIKTGPDMRRQLLDDAVRLSSPMARPAYVDYVKALKSRNRVLKDLGAGLISEAQGIALLESLQPGFIGPALEVIRWRQDALERLNPFFQFATRDILGASGLQVELRYDLLDDSELLKNPSEAAVFLKNRLEKMAPAERSLGSTLVGPHRHDLTFLYTGNDARFFCSQGQQRTLILAFKIAQIVYHGAIHNTYPLLILDDVLSELDAEKRQSLVRFLKSLETQTLLTTTDISVSSEVQSENLVVMNVASGKVARET